VHDFQRNLQLDLQWKVFTHLKKRAEQKEMKRIKTGLAIAKNDRKIL